MEIEDKLIQFDDPTAFFGLEKRPLSRLHLKIWCSPEFLPLYCYGVISEDGIYYVRKTFRDQPRKILPKSIESKIGEAQFENIISELFDLKPYLLIRNTHFICDGAEIGFEVNYGEIGVRVNWMSGVVEEFKGLEKWVDRTKKKFDTCLKKANPLNH